MGNTNCFCHLNNFAVKDAEARANIEKANRKIDETSTELRQQMSDLAYDVETLGNTVGELDDKVTDVQGEIDTIVGHIGNIDEDIEAMKEDIEALENQSGGGSVDSEELDEIKEDIRGIKSDNLVSVLGSGYISESGVVMPMTRSGEILTDYIEIEPGHIYNLQVIADEGADPYVCGICYYGASKNFINRVTITQREYNIYADTNHKYVRIYARTRDCEGRIILREASTPFRYEESYEELTRANDDYNVKSIAHRGLSEYAPENTASAFRLAKRKGFKYVEGDVCFTRDGYPVMHHDSTIDRISNGTGNIYDYSLAELQQFDFGYSDKFGDKYAGEKILTFDAFMKLCRDLGLHPYVELKQFGSEPITELEATTLLTIVDKYGMRGKMTWISLDYTSLYNMTGYDPYGNFGLMCNAITEDIMMEYSNLKSNFGFSQREELDRLFVGAYYTEATDDNIREWFGSTPVTFVVWTLDNLAHYSYYNVSDRVSGIISNCVHWGEVFKKRSML